MVNAKVFCFRAYIPSAFPSGGSKVIRGIIALKEGEPGNEASVGGS